MVIHTLNLINTCYENIKARSLTQIIENGKKNHSLISAEDYAKMVVELKAIVDTFLNEERDHNSIATIIDRYRNTLWNDFHVQTRIDITYRKEDNIVGEYSCAVTPQVRQTGNRLSRLAGTAYASLLA